MSRSPRIIISRTLTFFVLAAISLAGGQPAPQKAGAQAPSAATPRVLVSGCGYSQPAADLLAGLSQAAYTSWIRQISGADPVSINGSTVYLNDRYTPKLFDIRPSAYDFVLQRLREWYPEASIEEDVYIYPDSNPPMEWRNLILTIPGSQFPDEVVILSAHLDSTTRYSPGGVAPGADDNASGSAALLEAARVMQGKALPRTLRLIWFTGEEQGMKGSAAYLLDPAHPERKTGIVGVINLDMFGYDSDNDRCFELHISSRPDQPSARPSRNVGACVAMAIHDHKLDLSYDYITYAATPSSDHASFWAFQIGAVEVLENYYTNAQPEGCVGRDRNPYYHNELDTIDHINLTTAFDITRAALAAAFSLADATPAHPLYLPLLRN